MLDEDDDLGWKIQPIWRDEPIQIEIWLNSKQNSVNEDRIGYDRTNVFNG